MPQFSYSALDQHGRSKKGLLEAASSQAAMARLREMGLMPYEIGAVRNLDAPFWRKKISFGSGISKSLVAATTRQLATLLSAGVTLDKALAAISGGKDNMAPVVASLHETILEGRDLATGLTKHGKTFSSTYIAMTRAGEASGTLDLVMDRLAGFLEREVALRRKLRSALAYPLLMLVVGTAVVIFLLSFVIPQVTRIFADMGRELPLPTRLLLAFSDAFRNWWWLGALVFVVIGFIIWQSKKRHQLDAYLFSIPLAGKLYGRNLLGNWARTLGMLLKNGVPLLNALEIVQSASDNIVVRQSVGEMITGAQSGQDLSTCMNNSRLFPAIAKQMVIAGEKSGHLPEMLLWVAKDAENQVEAELQTLTSLLEPVMILILGALVGFVVIAIILPIFEMSSLAG